MSNQPKKTWFDYAQLAVNAVSALVGLASFIEQAFK